MKLERIFTFCLLAATLLSSSCSKKAEDPYQAAIIQSLKQSNPGMKGFSFTLFELTDSTSYEREICRRAKIFEAKRDYKLKRAESFNAAGKRNNERQRRQEAAHADSILTAILQMKEAYADRLDETLYYSFHFNGNARMNDGSTTRIEDWYATIDKNFKVYTMQQGSRKLNQAMGAAIPGYLELIESFHESEDTAESGEN